MLPGGGKGTLDMDMETGGRRSELKEETGRSASREVWVRCGTGSEDETYI